MSQPRASHATVLAQADQLAASGRSSDAEALYRFAIDIDPLAPSPRLGLARAQAARGEAERAVDDLVAAARECLAASPDPAAPYSMFALALELAPDRLELHVDLAEAQAAAGDSHGAQTRLAQLSMAYIQAGRHEDARAVVEVADSWDSLSPISGTINTALPLEESIPILLEDLEDRSGPGLPLPREGRSDGVAGGAPGVPVAVASDATICTPTLLRDAAGGLLPNQSVVPAPPIDRDRHGRPKPPRKPVAAAIPRPRTKTGRARAVPTSTSALRTLRARAKVRAAGEASSSVSTSLAHRLRKLGGLPR